MTFDITSYLKFISLKADEYMLKVLDTLTTDNPDFINKLKQDKDLFNADGSPRTDMTKDQIDEKIKSIMSDADFKNYVVNKEDLYTSFVITQEDVDKFILE